MACSLDSELQSGSARRAKCGSFLSRDTCRGCNRQKNEAHDEYINGLSQTAAWPQQGEGPAEPWCMFSEDQACPGDNVGPNIKGTDIILVRRFGDSFSEDQACPGDNVALNIKGTDIILVRRFGESFSEDQACPVDNVGLNIKGTDIILVPRSSDVVLRRPGSSHKQFLPGR